MCSGDIAVLQDPQGAVFSVLNTVSGDPVTLPKQSGNWMWQEVWTQDVAQSQAFYQQLGQYKNGEKTLAKNSYQYLTINNKPAFGFVKKPNADVSTTWVNYIRVDNVKTTIEKVKQNGGVVLMAPTKAVRNGTVAIIRDPAGAGFVMQESKK
ncbi:VOC family protein [Vibrio sp. S11_S32]|uniref:VOC family protein n=1 Tax=Vibrio sp. S11_S32 TaxID=2720225 RepID=UPI0019326A2F|nr:VOC family protein [Vibrio sp. S11_S32]